MEHDAAEQLVIDNMDLVYHIVRKYRNVGSEDFEDLVQEGMIGLVRSAKDFDPEKGFKFSTYAYPNIEGCITRRLRDYTPFYEPRRSKEMYYKVVKYKRIHGEDCDEDQMLKDLDIDPVEYREFIMCRNSLSIDSLVEGSKLEDVTYGDLIPDSSSLDELNYNLTEATLIDIESKVILNYSKLHQDIYDEYFFTLLAGETVSQPYLAKKYGISQAQVSRVIRKITKAIYEEFTK